MTLQPGETVDVIIRGATVVEPRSPKDTSLTLRYHQVDLGVWATLELAHPEAANVTVERVAPTDWPPQMRDVWREETGKRKRWFAYEQRGELWLCSEDGDRARPADLLRVAQLTLEHRAGGAAS